MFNELLEDFRKREEKNLMKALEKKAGRKLVQGKDRVVIDHVHRVDEKSGFEYTYGAVIFNGDIFGLLVIDYSEPCLVFIPTGL